MKTLTVAISLIITTALVAQTPPAPRNRTIIVRDGKVIQGDSAMPFRAELLGGKRAHLGVSLIDLTSELREHYGASKDAGVLVGAVEDGSPADKAGLRVGDIILSVDGKEVDSSTDLRLALTDKKEGDSVRLEVLRGRSRQTLVAGVVEREGTLRFMRGSELRELPLLLDSPEWRARLQSMAPGNCNDLQSRIKELEGRLKELEKKLQR
ncbi:MAG: serine protease Do [Acidobacteriota bacterium]|jgi:membrane-associated protease RseP (regulator of RpoE activity)|nr:serine protease Do [Acidobacteriota bacterium]